MRRSSRQALGYAALAAFYAAADKAPEAKAAFAEAMKLNPKLSVASWHALQPGFIDSPPDFRKALIN
jgi:predicted Zn-dependent protease